MRNDLAQDLKFLYSFALTLSRIELRSACDFVQEFLATNVKRQLTQVCLVGVRLEAWDTDDGIDAVVTNQLVEHCGF